MKAGNTRSSRYDSDNVPYLNLNDDRPRLNYNNSDNANSHYGSASCGSFY